MTNAAATAATAATATGASTRTRYRGPSYCRPARPDLAEGQAAIGEQP